jgi:hypothetical protein
MPDPDQPPTLRDSIRSLIKRAWCAYKSGQASEVDLMLLWLEAAAEVKGVGLHPGWTISLTELFKDAEAGLADCADEQELQRRGLGWLSGALEGPKRRHFITADEHEITVVEAVDGALRSAKARAGTGPLPRRFRPLV